MWVIEHPGTMDFETYSEAGTQWDEGGQTWRALPGAGTKKSISAVGAAAYAEHPSTEVLTFSYKLPGDSHVTRWRPGQPNPQRLFDYLASGGLVEAHNVMFERLVWEHVCRRLYGWPALPAAQLRCSMAKARVLNLPGALGNLTEVLGTAVQKDADGKRLLDKFSVPRKPTKKDPRKRIRPEEDPEDGERLYGYCDTDVLSEEMASHTMFPMSRAELEFWQLDQQMNWRGIGVDIAGVNDMIAILEQALDKYGQECLAITGGIGPSQVQKLQGWLSAKGVHTASLDAEAIDEALGREGVDPQARRVLEIRSLVGSASVKKLYAMQRTTSRDGRVRNVIIHHGARTGRPTGDLVQPLNLPKAGPDLCWCPDCSCPSTPRPVCPWCGSLQAPGARLYKWPDVPKALEGQLPIDWVMPVMATRSLAEVERFFGDALLTISGCVRGMLQADPGNELISSDYSAIEAVVTAALAGCQWRLDAFAAGKDIYLVSCEQMGFGFTYEQYLAYKVEHGSSHPHRQEIGKPNELANGFGAWIGGYRGFDTSDRFTDDEVKANILKWRAASPEIVEFWGGQERRNGREKRLERFGLEGAFVNAVQYPGQMFTSHGIRFFMRGDALIMKLLSDRELTYHQPRLHPTTREWASDGVLEITYMTWNSNPKYGAMGWGPMKTYAGKLAENCIAEGTFVLTDKGWVTIENVRENDLVHDGVGLVNHQGVVYKGWQECIPIDGVLMTPDHKVLTNEGWEAASQSPRPYRPTLRDAGGPLPKRGSDQPSAQSSLGLRVRLRNFVQQGWGRRSADAPQGENPQLRVPDERVDRSGADHAWPYQSPDVRGLERDEATVPPGASPSVPSVRGARHHGVRSVAKQLRGILGGHVPDMAERAGSRPGEKPPRVLQGKLPVDHPQGQQPQQAEHHLRGHTSRSNDDAASGGNIRFRPIDASLPDQARLADGDNVSGTRRNQKRVYDIVNCGPRTRFVVRGDHGSFIVHNCVQATAHDIQRYGILALEAAGYPVVLHVYDEDVAEVPHGFGSIEEFEAIMARMPPWAAGWPIKASGGWRGRRYRKA